MSCRGVDFFTSSSKEMDFGGVSLDCVRKHGLIPEGQSLSSLVIKVEIWGF